MRDGTLTRNEKPSIESRGDWWAWEIGWIGYNESNYGRKSADIDVPRLPEDETLRDNLHRSPDELQNKKR